MLLFACKEGGIRKKFLEHEVSRQNATAIFCDDVYRIYKFPGKTFVAIKNDELEQRGENELDVGGDGW